MPVFTFHPREIPAVSMAERLSFGVWFWGIQFRIYSPMVSFSPPGKNSPAWQECVVGRPAHLPSQQAEERSYQNPTVPSEIPPLVTSCWALLPEETATPAWELSLQHMSIRDYLSNHLGI